MPVVGSTQADFTVVITCFPVFLRVVVLSSMLGAAHGTARCELVERSGSGDAKIQVPHGHAGDERAGKHGGDQIHDAVGAAQIDSLQVGEERIPPATHAAQCAREHGDAEVPFFVGEDGECDLSEQTLNQCDEEGFDTSHMLPMSASSTPATISA